MIYKHIPKLIEDQTSDDGGKIEVYIPLRIKDEGCVFNFSLNHLSYIDEDILLDDHSSQLEKYIPSSDDSAVMFNEYNEWCAKFEQPQNLDIIRCLTDIDFYKANLLSIVDKLSAAFEDNLNKDMFFTSSLGFKVNGDRRTKSNLQDIITFFDFQAQDGKIAYRDYNNELRELTKEQIQTLLMEHIANGNGLYEQKWTYQQLINNAESLDDLTNLDIKFEMMDFTRAQS